MPMPETMAAPETPRLSSEDVAFVEKVDRLESRFIERSAGMLSSGIGLASIAAGIIGPEAAIAGGALGLVAGYILPRLRRRP